MSVIIAAIWQLCLFVFNRLVQRFITLVESLVCSILYRTWPSLGNTAENLTWHPCKLVTVDHGTWIWNRKWLVYKFNFRFKLEHSPGSLRSRRLSSLISRLELSINSDHSRRSLYVKYFLSQLCAPCLYLIGCWQNWSANQMQDTVHKVDSCNMRTYVQISSKVIELNLNLQTCVFRFLFGNVPVCI
jgi:hypothetical protein